MRKLKLQIQMSIDGFVAGPKGELDWIVWNWDDKLKDVVNSITIPVDTILLGRKMADGFISHWKNVANNPDDPEFLAGKKFTDTKKIVFTKTLKESKWDNTLIASGDLVEEINAVKNSKGGDIIVYGGASFVSSLIKANLIDEYNLFINPVALGTGMTIFSDLENKLNFTLGKSESYECGITLIQYCV